MSENRKTCFVVQGFGKKTDYTDGRVLDLDASYAVIKQGVEGAGLECVRADEIVHSGTIDVPMYERLLKADVVIADLSTNNVNAAFELGVRYALRPYTTIVMAEDQFKNPFDLSHILIRRYKHLGEDIGNKEAERVRTDLKAAIQEIVGSPKTDSPVYTYLPGLQAPDLAAAAPAAPPPSAASGTAQSAEVSELVGEDNPSAKLMLDAAQEKIKEDDFDAAKVLLAEVKKLRPKDSFVLQQLALATYKSKKPSLLAALEAARDILEELGPETTNNPETLGLWGAVHKRLWEECGRPQCLDESIAAYERGFYLKQDHYTGINLAYLLNVRAVVSLKAGERDEATADFVLARRVRKDVIRYAAVLVDSLEDPLSRYWVVASLGEAAIGLEDAEGAAKWELIAQSLAVPGWMQETRQTQAGKLKALLQQYRDGVASA